MHTLPDETAKYVKNVTGSPFAVTSAASPDSVAFSTISDSIVSAFATGEQSAVKFKDVAASVVKAVEAEFIKLALVNPLKNLLLGSNSPDLLSVGGLAGKLLGNVGGGEVSGASSAATSAFEGAGTTLGGFSSVASAVTGAQTSIGSGIGGLLSSTLGILDFVTENRSLLQPSTVHSDTHGQSAPIFGLA
ncbi:MAG: hypothetical protein ACRYF2_02465, partial [Janthinobacterium lividum]